MPICGQKSDAEGQKQILRYVQDDKPYAAEFVGMNPRLPPEGLFLRDLGRRDRAGFQLLCLSFWFVTQAEPPRRRRPIAWGPGWSGLGLRAPLALQEQKQILAGMTERKARPRSGFPAGMTDRNIKAEADPSLSNPTDEDLSARTPVRSG